MTLENKLWAVCRPVNRHSSCNFFQSPDQHSASLFVSVEAVVMWVASSKQQTTVCPTSLRSSGPSSGFQDLISHRWFRGRKCRKDKFKKFVLFFFSIREAFFNPFASKSLERLWLCVHACLNVYVCMYVCMGVCCMCCMCRWDVCQSVYDRHTEAGGGQEAARCAGCVRVLNLLVPLAGLTRSARSSWSVSREEPCPSGVCGDRNETSVETSKRQASALVYRTEIIKDERFNITKCIYGLNLRYLSIFFPYNLMELLGSETNNVLLTLLDLTNSSAGIHFLKSWETSKLLNFFYLLSPKNAMEQHVVSYF